MPAALRGGLLVHSAGVRRGDRAVVRPGHSGAGKSTLSRLLEGRPGLVRMSEEVGEVLDELF